MSLVSFYAFFLHIITRNLDCAYHTISDSSYIHLKVQRVFIVPPVRQAEDLPFREAWSWQMFSSSVLVNGSHGIVTGVIVDPDGKIA